MSRYLLDTTVLIDHLHGRQSVIELLTELTSARHELGTCSVTVAELYAGLSEQQRPLANKLIESLEYWETSEEAARNAGKYRYEYARKGVALTITDALVAAIAVGNGAILITANLRHYPMKELKILLQPKN